MKSGFREFLTPPELPAPTEANHPARIEDVPLASDETPQALGIAAAGTGTAFSRDDHVHAAQDISAKLEAVSTSGVISGDGKAGTPVILSNGTEGQFIRAGASAPAYVNGGNQLYTLLEESANLTLAHFVKGMLVAQDSDPIRLTIQAQADEAYLDNSLLVIVNAGAGELTVGAYYDDEPTGIFVNNQPSGYFKLAQYESATLIRIGENSWIAPNITASSGEPE